MTTLSAPTISRVGYIDKARGLAIALMITDHLLLVSHGPHIFRETVTRAAMPLFFILSGNLVRRLSWRVFAIAVIGILLPLAVPWIDNPNVLLWYAVWSIAVILGKRYGLLPLLIAVPLCLASNGWAHLYFSSYWPFGLLGLMALGASIPRDWFRWAERLPEFLATVGRYPLSIYVGHLLILGALT